MPTLSASCGVRIAPSLFENQFGPSDRGHLGALHTYASGTEAKILIWIAEEFRNEHVNWDTPGPNEVCAIEEAALPQFRTEPLVKTQNTVVNAPIPVVLRASD